MAQSYLANERCFICAWCCKRLSEKDVVIDHVFPVARGGTNDLENLTVSCARCNSMKSDLPPDVAEVRINEVLER